METSHLDAKLNDQDIVQVVANSICLALAVPKCKVEPSEEDYESLAQSTQRFYSSELKAKFENFRSLNISVGRTLFGEGIPTERYNVYVELSIVASFIPSDRGTVPGKHWLGLSLVKADLSRYLSRYVGSLKGTPFVGATSIYIDQVETSMDKEKKDGDLD